MLETPFASRVWSHDHGAADDEQVVRATFRGLRELRDRQREHDWAGNVELNELSMGMSGDYPIAVEEGATIVRVGRSIFKEDFANL